MPHFTDTLNIYPSPIYQVSNVNWSAFLKGILPIFQRYSQLEQWHSWRAAIGQWRPRFAPNDYVAHQCVIGHCVGLIAAHGVSQMRVFVTSHPTHPIPSHPTPLLRPSHSPLILAIPMAERDGIKYHEIQPSEIEKVSYNKNRNFLAWGKVYTQVNISME